MICGTERVCLCANVNGPDRKHDEWINDSCRNNIYT